jgi:HK97 family phage portal protein
MAKRKKKEITQLQVLDPNLAYADNGVPQPESYDDLSRAYSAHVWVFRSVNVIATALAAVELLPYLQKSDGSWTEDAKHEFYSLLKRPNPYMSGYDLRMYTYAARKLTGNAYWYCETLGTNKIKEIWPLLPANVRPVATPKRMIDHYVYQVGGQTVRLDYENVIHFKSMNPDSFLYGVGSLSAAKNAVATDIFAQVWNKSFFKNAARPDGVLESDTTLRKEIRDRIISSWNAVHQGAGKVGKTAMLEGGLKYKQITAGAKDMDFVNLRKDYRIEIIAAFGVPPSVVGLLEYANYSNMEQQTKMFWDNTLLPDMKSVEETLTMRAEQITFRMGTVFQGDTSKVKALQANMKEQAEVYKMFVDGGIPPNEVIDALDLPFEHVEGGDSPRMPVANPFQQQPAQNPPPPPAKAIKDLNPPDDAAQARELRREVAWKRINDRVRLKEGEMESSMRGFFAGQRRRVLKALDERARSLLHQANFRGGESKVNQETMRIVFDTDKESELMAKPAGRLIKGTYFDFAVSVAGKINPDYDFDLNDPYADAWIKRKVSKLTREATSYTLESITQETSDAIAEAVATGFSEAETIAQVADRINAVFDFAQATRAERIARTEIIGAANAGSFEAMRKTGVRKKGWLSSRDERVRETHKQMDGQVVDLNEGFRSPSGAVLQFPGDPDGPAEEVIQCRCNPVAADDTEDF